jgi:hypothetical protein
VFGGSADALDDLALAADGGRATAVFSDVSGLSLRELNAQGRPMAAGVRIAERCVGGVAAAYAGGVLYVACLRPASPDATAASAAPALTLYLLDASYRVIRSVAFGTAGSRSRGVTIAVDAQRVLIGFQDAVVGAGRAWLAELLHTASATAREREPTLRVISDAAFVASAPSIALRGERAFAVWSELADGGDPALGRLMFGELGRARAPIALLSTSSAAPSPVLVAQADRWSVVFRDQRDAQRRVGLYLLDVGEGGQLMGPTLRLARADGAGRPLLQACGEGLVAAAPRTFGGDEFVGVVGVDLAQREVAGEQQFYEDSRAFSQVAAACVGGAALLLVAERGKPGRHRAGAHAVPFVCR